MEDGSANWTRLAHQLNSPNPPAVLLPLGAVEAHGPHLPLETDTLIARHLAGRVLERLSERHHIAAICAPALTATAASWAADFPGTFSLSPEAARAVLRDAIEPVRRAGARRLALVSVHFDPAHTAAVREVVSRFQGNGFHGLVYPDFTRRSNAKRIGGEFATGACHAGEFETSLMLVADPDKVKPGYRDLPAIEVDLAAAIRAGKTSFRDVGMDQAYCGHPSTASAAEGQRLYDLLASMVIEEALQAWAAAGL